VAKVVRVVGVAMMIGRTTGSHRVFVGPVITRVQGLASFAVSPFVLTLPLQRCLEGHSIGRLFCTGSPAVSREVKVGRQRPQ